MTHASINYMLITQNKPMYVSQGKPHVLTPRCNSP